MHGSEGSTFSSLGELVTAVVSDEKMLGKAETALREDQKAESWREEKAESRRESRKPERKQKAGEKAESPNQKTNGDTQRWPELSRKDAEITASTSSLGKAETQGCAGPGRCPSRRIHPASVASVSVPLPPTACKELATNTRKFIAPAYSLCPGTLCSCLRTKPGTCHECPGFLTRLPWPLHSVTSYQPPWTSSPSDLCSPWTTCP